MSDDLKARIEQAETKEPTMTDDQQPDESTQTESDWKRSIPGGRRCGITAHNGLNDGDEPNGWWVSWSPRNGNDHAEGLWEDWVNLARKILEEDARRKPTDT